MRVEFFFIQASQVAQHAVVLWLKLGRIRFLEDWAWPNHQGFFLGGITVVEGFGVGVGLLQLNFEVVEHGLHALAEPLKV